MGAKDEGCKQLYQMPLPGYAALLLHLGAHLNSRLTHSLGWRGLFLKWSGNSFYLNESLNIGLPHCIKSFYLCDLALFNYLVKIVDLFCPLEIVRFTLN